MRSFSSEKDDRPIEREPSRARTESIREPQAEKSVATVNECPSRDNETYYNI